MRFSKLFLPTLSILVLVGLTILTKIHTESSKAESISKLCQTTDRETCLTIEVLKFVREEPEKLKPLFDQFSSLLKNRALTDDPRIFSPLIHDVGLELAAMGIDPQTAFDYCPLNFKAGCLHGVVMGYLDENDTQDPTELFSFCDFTKELETYYANCIHGVGHELAAKMTDNLNTMLETCSILDSAVIHACTSGIFMEYSTGVHGTGRHTHNPPPGTVLLPCEEVDQSFKASCYVSLSAYRQYSSEAEPFEETAKTCQTVPKEYQNECFLGLAEKIMTATAENMAEAKSTCTKFSNELGEETAEACNHAIQQINELESVL